MEPDKNNWDRFMEANKASLLQSWAWGQFQKAHMNKAHYLKGRGWQCLVLSRRLPFGKEFLYAPYGPACEAGTEKEAFKELAVQAHSVSPNSVFLKIEPAYGDERIAEAAKTCGFVRAAKTIQPQDTMIINIEKSEQELLDAFKEICRRRIREAQKKNVIVGADDTESGIEEFIGLMRETGRRDAFRPHPAAHYRNLIKILRPLGQAELILAKMNGETVAGAIIGYFGGTAYYLHAASKSVSEFRPSHAVIWEAIKSAKKRGGKVFDLYGVAPANSSEKHPWAGLTKFKETFNAERVHYIGGFDLPMARLWYRAYRIAKSLRT